MLHGYIWVKNKKDIKDLVKWISPNGSKIQSNGPILIFFIFLSFSFHDVYFEPKFDVIIFQNKKSIFPPTFGSRQNFMTPEANQDDLKMSQFFASMLISPIFIFWETMIKIQKCKGV